MYAGITVAPICSSVVFTAYHVLGVWISVEELSSVVYGNYDFAFEDAASLEDLKNLVVCLG